MSVLLSTQVKRRHVIHATPQWPPRCWIWALGRGGPKLSCSPEFLSVSAVSQLCPPYRAVGTMSGLDRVRPGRQAHKAMALYPPPPSPPAPQPQAHSAELHSHRMPAAHTARQREEEIRAGLFRGHPENTGVCGLKTPVLLGGLRETEARGAQKGGSAPLDAELGEDFREEAACCLLQVTFHFQEASRLGAISTEVSPSALSLLPGTTTAIPWARWTASAEHTPSAMNVCRREEWRCAPGFLCSLLRRGPELPLSPGATLLVGGYVSRSADVLVVTVGRG